MENAEKELTAFAEQWDAAMLTNNIVEISKFLTKDWIIIGANGTTSRASFLQSISSGSVSHHQMTSDETIIKILGETGVIISRGTSAGKYNGNAFHLYEWSMSVCIKSDHQWRCAITMLTPADQYPSVSQSAYQAYSLTVQIGPS